MFNRTKSDPKGGIILALGYLALVLAVEFVTPRTRLTPSLLTFGLTLLAFYVSPRVIMFFSLVYSGVAWWSLVVLPSGGIFEPGYVIVMRVVLLFAVGWLSASFALIRRRLAMTVDSALTILDSTPMPLIASDSDENIVYVNRAAERLLDRPVQTLLGLSYFSVFEPEVDASSYVPVYHEVLDNPLSAPRHCALHIREDGVLRTLDCSLTRVSIVDKPLLLTQILHHEGVAQPNDDPIRRDSAVR